MKKMYWKTEKYQKHLFLMLFAYFNSMQKYSLQNITTFFTSEIHFNQETSTKINNIFGINTLNQSCLITVFLNYITHSNIQQFVQQRDHVQQSYASTYFLITYTHKSRKANRLLLLLLEIQFFN